MCVYMNACIYVCMFDHHQHSCVIRSLYHKDKKYRILTYPSNDGNKFVNVWHMDFIALCSTLLLSHSGTYFGTIIALSI